MNKRRSFFLMLMTTASFNDVRASSFGPDSAGVSAEISSAPAATVVAMQALAQEPLSHEAILVALPLPTEGNGIQSLFSKITKSMTPSQATEFYHLGETIWRDLPTNEMLIILRFFGKMPADNAIGFARQLCGKKIGTDYRDRHTLISILIDMTPIDISEFMHIKENLYEGLPLWGRSASEMFKMFYFIKPPTNRLSVVRYALSKDMFPTITSCERRNLFMHAFGPLCPDEREELYTLGGVLWADLPEEYWGVVFQSLSSLDDPTERMAIPRTVAAEIAAMGPEQRARLSPAMRADLIESKMKVKKPVVMMIE